LGASWGVWCVGLMFLSKIKFIRLL
jgi:hypothetical protein